MQKFLLMHTIERRTKAFVNLGEILSGISNKAKIDNIPDAQLRDKAVALAALINTSQQQNGWFTPEFVSNALVSLGESLKPEKLERWVTGYRDEFKKTGTTQTVAVIMAGNVPAVGFHDFLSVLIAGHKIVAKLSSDDDKLMPAIADVLTAIEPGFKERIEFTDGQLKHFDAVIATGSNNSSRYFDYYFGKYPNIIRRNRNGVAVLTGNETEKELNALADDIFLYFGLGCRNVAKLFVPAGYDFTPLMDVLSARKEIADNNKYFNNYEYNKAIFMINGTQHFDTGNLLLTESSSFASPVSVLHFSYYQNSDSLKNELLVNHDKIQCVASNSGFIQNSVPFGQTQSPELWDYADGVDTLKFLFSID